MNAATKRKIQSRDGRITPYPQSSGDSSGASQSAPTPPLDLPLDPALVDAVERMWHARKRFLCGARGPCDHREFEVEVAQLEASALRGRVGGVRNFSGRRHLERKSWGSPQLFRGASRGEVGGVRNFFGG